MSMRRILVSTPKKKRNVLSPGVVREIAIASDKEGGGPVGHARDSVLFRQRTPVLNKVIPCEMGPDCSWPACSLLCAGRPGN